VLHATEALRVSMVSATLQIQRVSQVPTVSEEPAALQLLSRSITLTLPIGAAQVDSISPDRFDGPLSLRHQLRWRPALSHLSNHFFAWERGNA
jgi:hypothetical protein